MFRGGCLDIPAVENGGFQDDRCLFKPTSIFVGNEQSFKLTSSCYALKINYLADKFQKNTPQYLDLKKLFLIIHTA